MAKIREAILFVLLILTLSLVASAPQLITNDPNLTYVLPAAFIPRELTVGFSQGHPGILLKSISNLVSYMFVHFDINHLIGNALYLIPSGLGVAYFTGAWKGFKYYIVLGVLAVLGQYAMDTTAYDVILGGSGAVFGLMGMFVSFRFLDVLPKSNLIATFAAYWFIYRGLKETALIFLDPGIAHNGSLVAHTTHASGFFAGILLGFIFFLSHIHSKKMRM